jgi:hypothetical protein
LKVRSEVALSARSRPRTNSSDFPQTIPTAIDDVGVTGRPSSPMTSLLLRPLSQTWRRR